eukprot:scaffold50710_cov298-Isochrysis_galbana.AAC.3
MAEWSARLLAAVPIGQKTELQATPPPPRPLAGPALVREGEPLQPASRKAASFPYTSCLHDPTPHPAHLPPPLTPAPLRPRASHTPNHRGCLRRSRQGVPLAYAAERTPASSHVLISYASPTPNPSLMPPQAAPTYKQSHRMPYPAPALPRIRQAPLPLPTDCSLLPPP